MPGAVIKDVFVDLICDGQNVEFNTQVADQFEFASRKHVAGGIIRRIYDDGLGVTVKRRAEFALIETPLAIGRVRRASFTNRGLAPERIASGP